MACDGKYQPRTQALDQIRHPEIRIQDTRDKNGGDGLPTLSRKSNRPIGLNQHSGCTHRVPAFPCASRAPIPIRRLAMNPAKRVTSPVRPSIPCRFFSPTCRINPQRLRLWDARHSHLPPPHRHNDRLRPLPGRARDTASAVSSTARIAPSRLSTRLLGPHAQYRNSRRHVALEQNFSQRDYFGGQQEPERVSWNAVPGGFGGGGREDVDMFETRLGLRMDYEACLAYLLLPPAGGVLLLVLEHRSDYVRFHAWQSSLLFAFVFVSLEEYFKERA